MPLPRLAPMGGPALREQSMDAVTLGALSLPGTDGTTHRLDALWRERPVVLVFLRHFG
jgi:hypothetical protein